jgi:ATP-binding cassette, subfamily B (MDR/TAP), member 1
LAVFWGILFGFMSLSAIGPYMALIMEGKVAGKLSYDVIDRKPVIDMDAPGKDEPIKGEIEFKNVKFYYPSRADQTILNNFNCKFELGKTTAIVGPSGSGKSTIVQMLLRFYDPAEGQILIDGQPLTEM